MSHVDGFQNRSCRYLHDSCRKKKYGGGNPGIANRVEDEIPPTMLQMPEEVEEVSFQSTDARTKCFEIL